MNYEALPRIRLEVEQMKHAILAYIGANNSDLGEALKVEIERAIETYDWQGQVTKIVHEALTKHVADYFNYGAGRESVRAAVNEGFEAVLGDSA